MMPNNIPGNLSRGSTSEIEELLEITRKRGTTAPYPTLSEPCYGVQAHS